MQKETRLLKVKAMTRRMMMRPWRRSPMKTAQILKTSTQLKDLSWLSPRMF
jgi:hypothetical protein